MESTAQIVAAIDKLRRTVLMIALAPVALMLVLVILLVLQPRASV